MDMFLECVLPWGGGIFSRKNTMFDDFNHFHTEIWFMYSALQVRKTLPVYMFFHIYTCSPPR